MLLHTAELRRIQWSRLLCRKDGSITVWGWNTSSHILSPVHSHTPVKISHGRDCNQITWQIMLPLAAISTSPLLVRNIFCTVLPSYRRHKALPPKHQSNKQQQATTLLQNTSLPFSLCLPKCSFHFLHLHNSFLTFLPLHMQKKANN